MTAAARRGERRTSDARGSRSRGKCAESARERPRSESHPWEAAENTFCEQANEVAPQELVRRPRMELADALRERGVDEHSLAELYVHVFQKLRRIIRKEADPKRALDNLKEFGRVMEPKRANERAADRAGAQVLVQLVHQVARPERGMEAPGAARSADAADECERVSPALDSFAPEMCAIDVSAVEPRADNSYDAGM